MDAAALQTTPRIGLITLGVLFASVCFGLVPFFSRALTEAGIAPHAVALYRYVLASVSERAKIVVPGRSGRRRNLRRAAQA